MADVTSQGVLSAVARKKVSVDLTTGLNHYWDLDGGTGWVDDVGGWTLTENGTVTDDATGGPDGGSAAVINASTDYLDRTAVAWDGAQDNFTASIWVKPSALGSTGSFWFNWRDDGTDDFIFQIFETAAAPTNKIAATIYDNADTESKAVSNTTASTAGTWYHMVLTDDGTTRRLYINGSEAATDTTTLSGSYTTNTANFAIGTSAWNKGLAALSAQGSYAMAGIWDIALTSDQVTALYNSGSGLRYAALPGPVYLSEYNFEETGIPTGWNADGGTLDWDNSPTPTSPNGGEVLRNYSATTTPRPYFNVSGSAREVYLQMKLENVAGWSSGSVRSLAGFRDSSNSALTLFGVSDTDNGVYLYANGAYGSASTTKITAGVWWHFWLRHEPSGTCTVAFSTDGVRPTSGNAFLSATGSSGVADRVFTGTPDPNCEAWYDRVLVSTGVISSNP